MKTIILFYSHSGNTKALAQKKASELGADIEEIVEVKKPFIGIGLYKAAKRKKTAIQPIKAQLGNFDKIIIMSPVWKGHPVSAINSAIDYLPSGKKIEIVMVSSGGGARASKEETKALVARRGCEVVGYFDVIAKRKGGEVVSQQM